VFFLSFNNDYYSDLSTDLIFKIFYGGLIFDVAGLLYLLSLYIFSQLIPFKIRYKVIYQKFTYWLYIIPLVLGVIVNLADAVYFHVTLKRTTFSVVEQFSNETNLNKLFFHFLGEYWYVFILSVIATTLIILANNIIKLKSSTIKSNIIYYTSSIAILILFSLLIIIAIRGGYSRNVRPITLSNANNYINKPIQRALVLNTPFTLIRTINVEGIEEAHFFSKEKQESIFTALHSGTNKSDSSLIKKNVVLFILESFSREHIGALNRHIPDYYGFTPFVDSLINHSYTFKNSFANGQKSICGMTSNIASIPTLKTPFVLSPYSGNNITTLASLLKSQNYNTAFFHGAPNGSMGFDAFAKQAGFDGYYGMNEYANDEDFDKYWGIWDEEFFQFYANKMNTLKEPFFTSIFSVSSHHPFNVPEKYENTFPEGKLPIQKTIAYTDFALKRFFQSARKMDWFKNTIFVITADHASTYNELSLYEYKSSSGVFGVPIIIYEPSNPKLKGYDDTTVVQQIDIMPTILNMLHYPNNYISFGTDMFDNSVQHFAIDYEHGYFLLFREKYLLRYDGNEIEGLYNYQEDSHLSKNLISENYSVKNSMLELMQAFIQEYNKRMINNDMVIPTIEN
jgi:phosphoglycerol transferase MdoB-like AlkP superfamily enzyme